MRRGWWQALVALTFAFLCVGAAMAQGIMVNPARVDIGVPPGRRGQVDIELRSTTATEQTVDVRIVDLIQDQRGSWSLVEAGSARDLSGHASCADWIRLPSNEVALPAQGREAIRLSIDVPHRVRGYYFAALIVESRPPEVRREGISLRVRFAVPIIVEIRGPAVRQSIRIVDGGMMHEPSQADRRGGTAVSLTVANEGQTYPQIRGNLQVMALWQDRWRLVSTVELRQRSIIPGNTLNLSSMVNRRLPSGTYRLQATLQVDGRSIRPFEKTLEFKGDPGVDSVALGAAIMLKEPEVSLTSRPGAMRTALLQVENASEDPVRVQAAAVTPPSLEGVVMGELRGTELSAAQMLTIRPDTFTIRGGGTQNVRILAQMPREGAGVPLHDHYYGLLNLGAVYSDGQCAGTTQALIHLANEAGASRPRAQIVNTILALDDGDKYIVQTQSANVGNIHFAPECKVVLRTPRGTAILREELAGEEGPLLPMQRRRFAGVMDFSGVETGTYVLGVSVRSRLGEASANSLLVLEVAENEDGEKVVEVMHDRSAERLTQEAADAELEG